MKQLAFLLILITIAISIYVFSPKDKVVTPIAVAPVQVTSVASPSPSPTVVPLQKEEVVSSIGDYLNQASVNKNWKIEFNPEFNTYIYTNDKILLKDASAKSVETFVAGYFKMLGKTFGQAAFPTEVFDKLTNETNYVFHQYYESYEVLGQYLSLMVSQSEPGVTFILQQLHEIKDLDTKVSHSRTDANISLLNAFQEVTIEDIQVAAVPKIFVDENKKAHLIWESKVSIIEPLRDIRKVYISAKDGSVLLNVSQLQH